jgi:hypothetical protein
VALWNQITVAHTGMVLDSESASVGTDRSIGKILGSGRPVHMYTGWEEVTSRELTILSKYFLKAFDV